MGQIELRACSASLTNRRSAFNELDGDVIAIGGLVFTEKEAMR